MPRERMCNDCKEFTPVIRGEYWECRTCGAGNHVTETHFVMGEIEAYESPASGKMITSRTERREDFKRTGTRPWEGQNAERQEAQKRVVENERKLDHMAEKAAWQSWYRMNPDTRKKLMYR